jgi:hypothetical protein
MGQNVSQSKFTAQDFADFDARLKAETKLMQNWEDSGHFDDQNYKFGYELEAWLLDSEFYPAPLNRKFLTKINSPYVVPELAFFNIELNAPPYEFTADCCALLKADMDALWHKCQKTAHELNAKIMAVGILPTVRPRDISLYNMSARARYQALNAEVLKARGGKPLVLDIKDGDGIYIERPDVMLESVTTSLQIHLQVPMSKAYRFYNAAKIISAPSVAISANAPYLFGRNLWAETRIPVFEKSINIGADDYYFQRVTFGTNYASKKMSELFVENIDRFAVLLPGKCSDKPEDLSHLHVHNGTIWRWNRPLIGFNDDGQPHFRVEHRVNSAGPTSIDQAANIIFFVGLVTALAHANKPYEELISLPQVRDNFYHAARNGLECELVWLSGEKINLKKLINDKLLGLVAAGLDILKVPGTQYQPLLDIIHDRVASGQNGSSWQRQWIKKHGQDWQGLTAAYYDNQNLGSAVHLWQI